MQHRPGGWTFSTCASSSSFVFLLWSGTLSCDGTSARRGIPIAQFHRGQRVDFRGLDHVVDGEICVAAAGARTTAISQRGDTKLVIRIDVAPHAALGRAGGLGWLSDDALMRDFKRIAQGFNAFGVEASTIEEGSHLGLYLELRDDCFELFLDHQRLGIRIETNIEIDRAQFWDAVDLVRYASTDCADNGLGHYRPAAVGLGVAFLVLVGPFLDRVDELGHTHNCVRVFRRGQRTWYIRRVP